MFNSTRQEKEKRSSVAIIGLGWYGAQCALHLSHTGQYNVTVFEQNQTLFSGISGTFGVRLHIGPHYPRSEETRENCRQGRSEFQETYPGLINEHSHSIYGVGKRDVENKPSKVSSDQLRNICQETLTPGYKEVDLATSDFSDELESAFDIPEEASLALGPRLREYFNEQLSHSSVTIKYNYEVSKIIPKDGRYQVIATRSKKTIRNRHSPILASLFF